MQELCISLCVAETSSRCVGMWLQQVGRVAEQSRHALPDSDLKLTELY